MYTQGRYQVLLATAADLNTTGDISGAAWAPSDPHYIHKISVIVTNLLGGPGEIAVDLRPSIGDDTDRTDGTVGVLTLPDTTAAGQELYHRPSPPFRVEVGQEIVVQLTDATAAADTARIVLDVERAWEPEEGRPLISVKATAVA